MMKWTKFLACLPLLFGVCSSELFSYEEPLQCGHYAAKIKGSISNYFYTYDRPDVWIGPTLPLGFIESNGSNQSFRAPWMFGVEVGYAYSGHMELFGEVNYSFSKGRPEDRFFGTNLVHTEFSRFGAFGAYLGGRYYFERACWGPSFYIGGKLGILNYLSRRYNARVTSPTTIDFRKQDFTRTTISPSAGLQVGVDFLLCDGFSIDLMAEVIFSGSPKTNSLIVIPNNTLGITRIVIGQKGPALTYPISLAIRKAF
jgi:hypothetical protein